MSPSEPVTTWNMPLVTSPFPDQFPVSNTPKITTLYLRYGGEMIQGGLPVLDDDRYGPALTNLYAAGLGAAFSYEGEWDWCNNNVPGGGNSYSDVAIGTRATTLHDMWARNGMRFFTEIAYQGMERGSAASSVTLPPGQGLTTALPDSGMIRVTAPRDGALAVNVTYSGDWKVGASRVPFLSNPNFARRDFMFESATYLYRSRFQPSGDTLDWNSATHSAIWATRSPDYRSLIWYGERTITAGADPGDGSTSYCQPISVNAWDAVQPGETVHYWLARWVSSNLAFLPQAGGGSAIGTPLNGTADAWGNAGWVPAYPWQYKTSIPAGSSTQNTASWTSPAYTGQGGINARYVDATPTELPTLSTRSHCFQVVTF